MPFTQFIWDDFIGLLGSGDITSSTPVTGFPAVNVKDRREYTQFSPDVAGSSSAWIRFDLGSAKNIKALAIAGHNLGSSGATNVILSADNVGGAGHPLTNTIVPAFSPTNDRAIVKTVDDTYRYWELGFTTGPSIDALLGVIFLTSDYLEFPNPPNSPIDPDAVESTYSAQVGERGHLLGIIQKFKQRVFGMTFAALEQSWVENYWWPFFNANGHSPFFIVWDPNYKPDEVSYVRIASNAITSPYGGVWRSLTLQFTGLFDAQ